MPAHQVKKLLVICGPTATGKTRLALLLAKILKAEIISADSRQVYKGLDIGTGKDVPVDRKIWGYDLVGPEEEFSVANYRKFVLKNIHRFWKMGSLPILVGGTGLYIKAITDGINTVNIPKNNELRQMLENKTSEELFESLAQMDSIKAASMNYSDKLNPRRLVRAIEVATWKIDNKVVERKLMGIGLEDKDILFIGLFASENYLFRMVKNRVQKRVAEGVEMEIKGLLKKGLSWQTQAMTSLGYRQWKDYFSGKGNRTAAIADWEKEEIKYIRRQLVWFKNDSRINWFDISFSDFEKKVVNMVKKWYSDN